MKTDKSYWDFLFVLSGVVIILIQFLWLLMYFFDLPDVVPIHFNAEGEVDNHGSKFALWLLPMISAGLYFFLIYFGKSSKHFNYPVKITEKNKSIQHKLGMRFLLAFNSTTALLFLCILIMMIKSARTGETYPVWLIIALIFVLTFLPVIFYVIIARKHR